MSGFAVVKRTIGVDYGRARIGVAISDELGMLAHPLETIPVTRLDAAARRIAEIVREKDVAQVVLGMPRHMNGEMGSAAAEVNAFAEKLRPLLLCEMVLWDERLTTTAANRALRDSGQKTKHTRGIVDQVAAQMILQGYLDRVQSRQARAALEEPPE
ncbi:MAG: Holliday junction resolvase RuvX [Chthoniobacterales bacterium]|nr:Holliday junction resolvase RuvX [Chthoniobacterales bacterium]MDQ3120579.1 Holliday junction resolvase RuvX [Verrucomicrobiota bacterium]